MTILAAPVCRFALAVCLTGLAADGGAAEQAKPLTLVIQPPQGEAVAPGGYQALAAYLEQAVGVRINVVTPPNFLAHWETIRRDQGVDLVWDDAHFTDYRVQRLRFHVLAKAPGVTGYSLVAAAGARLRDPLSLAGKKVASFGPPSIGTTRLNAMFPNPARRPSIIDISTVPQALDLLHRKKVEAAMLPTAAVSEHVDRGRLVVLITMEPTPRAALSASPRVDTRTREKIRAALLRARDSDDGKRVLEELRFSHFEFAGASTYANQGRLLRDVWGY
ncbi:MAG TPA: PhnD/SsuA/transferrin family substrate-binding protein [Burkholderiales bacterium]|nr:PhnD/SsuA/transferrin family substrate-binding protein [Burkholderiales bacterium]